MLAAKLEAWRGWARAKSSPPHAPVEANVRHHVAHPDSTLGCCLVCGRGCPRPPNALRAFVPAASEATALKSLIMQCSACPPANPAEILPPYSVEFPTQTRNFSHVR